MGAGLLQLAIQGQFNNILFYNPSISFYNYAYKKHTNFAMENISHNFFNSPSMLSEMHKGGDYTINLDGNKSDIDLLSKIFFIFKLPDIYSNDNFKFKWVDNIGALLIKSASIRIDNTLIETIYGEWLVVWNELTNPVKDSFNNMVGNIPELTNPRKTETTIRITNNIISLYDYSASDKSNYNNPSIKSRILSIPLPFWFSKNPALSLPLIKLINKFITLKIEFENIENLYTIYSPIYNMNISPLHYNEIHKTNITINNFINNNNFYAYLEATYVILDTDERKSIMDSPISEFLIETSTSMTTSFPSGANSIRVVDVKSQLQVKEVIWTLKRNDNVNKFNNTLNYSYSVPFNNEKSIMKSAALIWDRGSTNARVEEKDAFFYNSIQPYQYHSTIPKQGIYCYSFAIYPEKWFPSGSYNSAGVSTKLFIKLNEYPKDYVDIIYNNNNIINNTDIICTVYIVQYNLLVFQSGAVGLKFQN